MNKLKFSKPSENELAILQVLWEREPATVKSVNEVLNQKKPTGYTTTLKLMQIMHDKGLVTRTTEGAKGKSHLYSSAVTEKQVNGQLLDQFIQRVFRGSASSMVMRAIGRSEISAEEIEEIRNFLDGLDNNPPS
ncbi:BlaI/MecI/CopY family transcriptional regulator [Tunicatimonas pelagia]|uniref:BlaI/MecI/CopY family transcriptional regulator n=1 Tax=Tunicatimonas pelagia TaxID=931531 RepID=UPI002665F975|nr:BlaI/MecI/CopY family transcriptional regulator [Tunicatimonas pelagia]WKN45823.1 BlaI/MecI/CopY family transcriptional regulator [Tunicatimonas pelagia]